MTAFNLASASRVSGNSCEALLRSIASLLVTSEFIAGFLGALRRESEFSGELAATLDSILAATQAGPTHLYQPLAEVGAKLPPATDTAAGALITGFFLPLPAAGTLGVLTADVANNLRMLMQHVERKAHLAAEEALMVGQNKICHGLMLWAGEWRACDEGLRAATIRSRTKAYIAGPDDVDIAVGA